MGNQIENIAKYIAAWGWFTLALMFLSLGFILFAMPRTTISMSFYVAFVLVFIGCMFMALKRRSEFFNENE